MYTSYWGLRARPFEPVADSRFYYPCEAHQAALLKLRYALENRRAAALMAGAAGVGKTALLQRLDEQMPQFVQPRLLLRVPQLEPLELLRYVADGFAPAAGEPAALAADISLRRIEQAVHQNVQQGRLGLLIIDEAHLLEPEHLELLRLLTNFQGEQGSAITVFLSGQPPLVPAVDRFPAFEERLGVKCLLRPLSPDESIGYVSHRLRVAGCDRQVFDESGLEALYELSGGFPRKINRLADLALLVGYAEQTRLIGRSHVEAVCDELMAVQPD